MQEAQQFWPVSTRTGYQDIYCLINIYTIFFVSCFQTVQASTLY